MKVYGSILETIGKTPIVKLSGFMAYLGIDTNIFGKLESFNPTGSVKDRMSLAMIERAEQEGKLKKGSTIIEPTSGNTGIGLAAVAAAKGYKLIITMPETMSVERRSLVKAYGATVVLTDGTKGMKGAIAKVNELVEQIPDSFVPAQFSNPYNPDIHYKTTGPEIWEDMGGNIDIFVSGVGTGGTISGVGKFLKEKNKNIMVVAVEPKDSPMLSKGVAGPHKIQGLGSGFVPDTLDTSIYDEVIAVSNEDAFETGRILAKTDAMLMGVSSGAAMWAAFSLSKRVENKGKNIVVILPDTGERYLSTPMFSDIME